jgi:thiamine biosynthesis lipoprotein ApbE
MGHGPDDQPWRVASDAAGVAAIPLTDLSFSMSDAARQLSNGQHHIVDPRRRADPDAPPHRRTRVIVTGPSARLSDAWSTALAVLGDVPATFPEGYTARWI